MRKIITSLSVIALVASIALGATSAFFSDKEQSVGNTFTAGAIDLKIDNESFYNGVLNQGTTWLQPSDLNDGEGPGPNGEYFFFDFHDLKPDDWGEDTISIHVDTNDAWACMNITLTKNDDISSTEPELSVDVPENPVDSWDGELAQQLNFIWWVDDGDNVLEDNETPFWNGPLSQILQDPDKTLDIVLADSTGSKFGGGPLTGSTTYYLGKGWCFGTLTPTPVPQGQGVDPTVKPGFDCDGKSADNSTQTDSVMGDISFSAVQARHNDSFKCFGDDEEPKSADLRLDKSVDKAEATVGTNVVFTIVVTNDGPDTANGVTVKDLLPAKATYVSDDGGGSYDPITGIWTIGTLASSASVTLNITAKINDSGAIKNTAEVQTAIEPDPDSTPGNSDPGEDDQDSATVNGISADLELDKTVNVDTQVVENSVTFTITITNKGPSTATGISVTDNFPDGLSYVSHIATDGVYDPVTDTWTIASIPSGGVRFLHVTVETDSVGTYTNSAEVKASDLFDPDSIPGNGSITEDDDDKATVEYILAP